MPTEHQTSYTFLPAFATRATRLRGLSLIKSFTVASAVRLAKMLLMMPFLGALTISGIARGKFGNRDCLAALPEVVAELPHLKTFTVEKGAIHQEMLARIVSSFCNRVEFSMNTCSLFVADVITDVWDDFESEMLDDFGDHVDVVEWDEVTFETAEDAAEFDYD